MGDKNFAWYMGAGKDPESCHGPYATREDAIAEGRGYGHDNGFTVMEADKAVPSLPDADDLISEFLDNNEELADPDGDCFGTDFKASREQEDELTAAVQLVFRDWLDKHKLWPTVWAFGAMRNQEYFAPAEVSA